jgi:rhomboid family GlyGly-CTERM serine protease
VSLVKRYRWLAASLVLLYFLPADWLELQRQAVLQSGQLWRIFAAHWTHVSPEHLVINVLGLLVLGNLFYLRDSFRVWLLSLSIVTLGVSLGLLVMLPELNWYRGFSGCLYGLFVYECARHWRAQPWTSGIVLFLIFGKLVLDSLVPSGHGVAALIGAPVIDSAHVVGASVGFTMGVVRLYFFKAN